MLEPTAPLTLAIVALTCLMSFVGFRDPRFVDRFIFSPEPILRARQGYRLITAGFLHADLSHLLFNLYSFYSFGRVLEWKYGPGTLALIYFASILGGNLLSLYLHRHHEYRALGASGGVCGVIFAAIFLTGSGVGLFFIPYSIPPWLFAIGYLLVSFYGLKQGRDNIGHDAHLGGAITGQLAATALFPEILKLRPGLYASVLGLSLVLLFYLIKNPMLLPLKSFFGPGSSLITRRHRSPPPLTPEQQARRVDEILDKLSRSGMGSLTQEEQEILREASRKARRRGR